MLRRKVQTVMTFWITRLHVTAVAIDNQAPVGSLQAFGAIDFDGTLATLDSPNLILDPYASDNWGSVSEMRMSYDGTTWDAWQNYSTSPFEVTLPQSVIDNATGSVTVYMEYRDPAGNVSSSYNDTLTFTSLSPGRDYLGQTVLSQMPTPRFAKRSWSAR